MGGSVTWIIGKYLMEEGEMVIDKKGGGKNRERENYGEMQRIFKEIYESELKQRSKERRWGFHCIGVRSVVEL